MKDLMSKFRGKQFFVNADNITDLVGKRVCYRFGCSDDNIPPQGIALIKAVDVTKSHPFIDYEVIEGHDYDLEYAFICPYGEPDICLADIDYFMMAKIIEDDEI